MLRSIYSVFIVVKMIWLAVWSCANSDGLYEILIFLIYPSKFFFSIFSIFKFLLFRNPISIFFKFFFFKPNFQIFNIFDISFFGFFSPFFILLPFRIGSVIELVLQSHGSHSIFIFFFY